MADAAKGVGRPKVGGTFELLDHEGKAFTDQDMRGVFSLVSFYVCFLQREREERKCFYGGYFFLSRRTTFYPSWRFQLLIHRQK